LRTFSLNSKARQRYFLVVVGCLLSALLALALNLGLTPKGITEHTTGGVYRVDPSSGFPAYSFGLHEREHATQGPDFTWTTAHATIPFPYAGNAGRHLRVTLTLAAQRPPGEPPPTVVVSLNGHPYPSFIPAQGYVTYSYVLDTAQIPNPYMHPADLQVDIQSATFTPPGDPRELGVALAAIEVHPEKSKSEAAIAVIIWALATLALLLVASSRLNLTATAIYAAAMLLSFAILHLTYLPRAINQNTETALAGVAWVMLAWLVPRRRPMLGLLLAVALLWVVGAGGRWPWWGDFEVDDAFISYRYAWNLVHGNGLVYNPGTPVEGYTNFLWTILMSVALVFDLEPTTLALALNIALTIGIAGLTYYLGIRLGIPQGRSEIYALGAAILLVFDRAIVTYGPRGSGMESIFFAFLVLLAFAILWTDHSHKGERALLRWRVLGGVVLALAALTRPEGVMVAAVLLLARAWQDRRAGRRQWKSLAVSILSFAAIVVPYQAWRITFYGYPLPNTFYAKTGTTTALIGRGLEYVWDFALAHWFLVILTLLSLLLALLALVSAARKPTGADVTANGLPGDILAPASPTIHNSEDIQSTPALDAGGYTALAWLVGIYTAYIVVVGGDWLTADRFFVPLVAPLALLAQAATWRLDLLLRPNTIARRVAPALLAAMVLGYAFTSLLQLGERSTVTRRSLSDELNTRWWAAAGFWLREHTPPDTLVAVQGAGAIAYYGQRPVLDMFGLNDLYIAHRQVDDIGTGKAGHEKKDPEYVLSQRPDYIVREWEMYFGDKAPAVENLYSNSTVRTPTGWDIPLLTRKPEAEP
jgi:arabinofuranosyltransferase